MKCKTYVVVLALLAVCAVGAVALAQAPGDAASDAQRFEEAKRRLAERQRLAAEAKARAASQPAVVIHPASQPAAAPTTAPAPSTAPSSAALAPAPATPAVQQPIRAEKEILAELDQEEKAIYVGYPLAALVSPRYRTQFVHEAAPRLRHHLELLDELAQTSPAHAAGWRVRRCTDLALLALYTEPQAAAELTSLSSSKNPTDVVIGRAASVMRDWWHAPEAEAQRKLLEPIGELARSYKMDDVLTPAYLDMAKAGAASDEMANAVRDIIESTLASPAAMKYKARPDKLGRPLTVTGATVQGKPFSTAPWKGKVVVLDFWATWCPPCREALPHVAALYQANHERGLEIVGVSCDSRKPDLQQFLTQHPEITWPQLFGPSGKDGWHALAAKFQVTAVPTMYVIDRNGILRDIEIARIPEPLILELLNEEAKPAATATATPATRPVQPSSTSHSMPAPQPGARPTTAPAGR